MVSLNLFVVVVTLLVLALAGAIALVLRLRRAVAETCVFGWSLGRDLDSVRKDFDLEQAAGVLTRPLVDRQTERVISYNWYQTQALLDKLNPIDRALDPADWVWRIKRWWRRTKSLAAVCGRRQAPWYHKVEPIRIMIVDDK